MTRRTLGVAGLVSALLVGLLGIGATSAAADLEDDEVIAKGRVVFNGEPVEKAEVRLVSRDGRSGGAATTDRSRPRSGSRRARTRRRRSA